MKKDNKYTHTGTVIRFMIADHKINQSPNTNLRETKTQWISRSGARFRKKDGYQAGLVYRCGHPRLDLKTIKAMEDERT